MVGCGVGVIRREAEYAKFDVFAKNISNGVENPGNYYYFRTRL